MHKDIREAEPEKRDIYKMKQSSIKLIIFDLDGTLVNTLEDLADSLNVALRKAA